MKHRFEILSCTGAAIFVAGSIGFLRYIWQRKKASKKKSYPKNLVILHQFEISPLQPSVSPFCLKLETWLRINKIYYQVVFQCLFE